MGKIHYLVFEQSFPSFYNDIATKRTSQGVGNAGVPYSLFEFLNWKKIFLQNVNNCPPPRENNEILCERGDSGGAGYKKTLPS